MALTEEPILSRLHRLDIMLRHLEEIKGSYNRSPKSSGYEASTPSSGTLTSEGGISSVHSTPNSLEKHCRPIDDVIMETEIKGSLIDRVVQVENRVMKLCVLLEEEIDAQKKQEGKKQRRKKGLKGLFQSCVSGKSDANA